MVGLWNQKVTLASGQHANVDKVKFLTISFVYVCIGNYFMDDQIRFQLGDLDKPLSIEKL